MGFGLVGKGFLFNSALSEIDESSPDDRITRRDKWAESSSAPPSDAFES